MSYICNFDIFFLFETHVVSEKQCNFSSYFKKHSLYWIPAIKTHNSGRASGGCLYGFKKEIQKSLNLKFINYRNNIILSSSFNNNTFYFIPKYLNCTRWKVEFENFEDMLIDLNPSNFCIIGDLNCRIGEEQVIDENELLNLKNIFHLRNSNDKTVNWQGKLLLQTVVLCLMEDV